MNASPGNGLIPSVEDRLSLNSLVFANGAACSLRRIWMAVIIPLALAAALVSAACGGGGDTESLDLVPDGATLIVEIEVADVLGKVDLDSLLDALPDEEDVPKTIDEVLDMMVGVTGVDLRNISRGVFFGDLRQEDDYFGLIVRGTIGEEALVAAVQRATGVLVTETYKGRDLRVPQNDPDSLVFTFLDEETLVLGSPDAVRHVIDVDEGDRKQAEGDVSAAFNDLPRGLLRLSMAVLPDALQDGDSLAEGLFGQQDFFGGAPIDLESFEDLEMFSFALGQDGDTLNLLVRLDFANEESASTVEDILDGLLKVAGALAPEELPLGFLDRMEIDREGSKLTVSLDLQLSELEDLLGGVLNIAQTESFQDQTPSPSQYAEREALQAGINALMADNGLVRVTTLPTATNNFSGLDMDPGDEEARMSSYLRDTTTIFYYCWSSEGRLVLQTDSPAQCPPGFGYALRILGPGNQVAIMPTRNHVLPGEAVAYSTAPPTSGDHWETWATCGFFPDGLPDELIVHNLEHGNIIVNYNLSSQQQVDELRQALNFPGVAGEWGVIRFYDKIPAGSVAMAAWGRLETMDGVDISRISSFFAAHAGNLGPERIPC